MVITHIDLMASTAKRTTAPTAARSSKTGKFLGQASDGTWIVRPDFKPKSFTVHQLRKAVREVQKRESEAKAG